MASGGRPKHEIWKQAYRRVKVNNTYLAKCMVCMKELKNTSVERLRVHRRSCKYHQGGDKKFEEQVNLPSPSTSNSSLLQESNNESQTGDEEVIRVIIESDSEDEVEVAIETPKSSYYRCKTPTQHLAGRTSSSCSTVSTSTPKSSRGSLTTRITANRFSQEETPKSGYKCNTPSPTGSSASSRSSVSVPKSNAALKSLITMDKFRLGVMSPEDREKANVLMAEFFFSCNIPFSISESTHFKKFCNFISFNAFNPVGRRAIASTYLNKVS